MAFAGGGSPSMGLSAMFWNPAAVTQTEDAQVETHLTGVFPQIGIQTLPGTSAQLMSLGSSSVSIGQPALLGAFSAHVVLLVGLAFMAAGTLVMFGAVREPAARPREIVEVSVA